MIALPMNLLPDTDREQHLSGVKSVVVKIGSQTLTGGPKSGLDDVFMTDIARQIATLRAKGIRITLVSSGAVAAGLAELKLSRRPADLAQLQAVAAVGQRRLMDVWAGAFAPTSLHVAQVLLTRHDIDDRTRYLNLRNTLAAADELNAVPVINENDTVSTDEMVRIGFGDNDLLAAAVAQAIGAQVLILLTGVDGLLDAANKPVRLVRDLDHARTLIRTEKSALGRGGMASKLTAAELMVGGGDCLLLAPGREPNVLVRMLSGETLGTLFAPGLKKRTGRKRWISSARPAGTLVVDAGAAAALAKGNKSLLPAGITSCSGDFTAGSVVQIADKAGHKIAQGLTNYDTATLSKIKGLKTQQVRALLQDLAYDEVIHKDNLVLAAIQ